MKRINFLSLAAAIILSFIGAIQTSAATTSGIEGNCGKDCKWKFDGYTLTVYNNSSKGLKVDMNNYNVTGTLAPWIKKKLNVKKVVIDRNVASIGSCAFANMPTLQEVEFKDTRLNSIGWGAFMNDTHLRTISLPQTTQRIDPIAFANCESLVSIQIPDKCRVGDQAFASCTNLRHIEIGPTAILGHYVFAGETVVNDKVRHTLYSGEVSKIPPYINTDNCNEFGLAPSSIEKLVSGNNRSIDYDVYTSELDEYIPEIGMTRSDTYALIIGNQNYRFVSDVPYAIHDARVFSEYCKKTLGIPSANIHLSEDATKQMILEEEFQDWLDKIPEPTNKKLIVYYAGHGVPDVKDNNKAYLLPTDVRGTNPKRGIALNDFYDQLAQLNFLQTTVFLDACFSGVNRESEGVVEGLRGVEIDPGETEVEGGNIVVFSASQGNETAQGYPEEGHGLFTYYLLKSLNTTLGTTNLGNLSDMIKEGVSTQAPQLKLKKSQTPGTHSSASMTNIWRMLQL